MAGSSVPLGQRVPPTEVPAGTEVEAVMSVHGGSREGYDFHAFEVIPRLGALAAGSAEPYRYLVESIRKFPKQEPFADMIRAAGFARATYRNWNTAGSRCVNLGFRVVREVARDPEE